MPTVFEDAYIALVEDPTQLVKFQVFPDTITTSKRAEWTNTETLGRSEPYRSYRCSGVRSISFTMRLLCSTEAGDFDVNNRDQYTSVKRKVVWLESLVHPTGGTSPLPPLVRLKFFDALDVRGIVVGVSAKYEGPWWTDTTNTALPMMAAVDITFDELNASPVYGQDIRAYARPASTSAPVFPPQSDPAPFDYEIQNEADKITRLHDQLLPETTGGFGLAGFLDFFL